MAPPPPPDLLIADTVVVVIVIAGITNAVLVKIFLPGIGQQGAVVLRSEEARSYGNVPRSPVLGRVGS